MMSYIKPTEPFLSSKRVNEVTFLSKVLSAVLFVSLPFVGFAIGFSLAGGNIGL